MDYTLYGLLGFLVLLVVIIKLYYRYCFSYWKKLGLYTVEPSFPFGNATGLYNGTKGFGEMFSDVYLKIQEKGLKHGGFYFWGKPVYIPVDNEIVKHIIVKDFEYFVNHGFYINEELEPMTAHIFNVEDGKWRNLRSKLPSAFTTTKMRKMFGEMVGFQPTLVNLLGRSEGRPVDIKEVLSLFSTDIITKTAFGLDTNCMGNKDLDFIKHGRTFFDDQWSTFHNTLVLLIPRKYLQMAGFKVLKKEGTDFFTKLFKDIKEFREKNGSNRNDLTDLLIRLTKNNADDKIFRDFNGKGTIDNLSFNEYAAQAYIFFEAGFETSSTTMTYALYELARNQDCQDLLREEINRVLKKYNGEVNYDAMLEMEYLDKVVDETLRIYPAFPVMPRACKKDYPVPGTDFVLKEGTMCMVTMLGIQLDPTFYPDPLRFDPERFSKENKGSRPTCAYMPFGEGPRICIGKRFGLLQTKAGLIAMIKNFKVTVSPKTKEPIRYMSNGIILKTKGGMWLNFDPVC